MKAHLISESFFMNYHMGFVLIIPTVLPLFAWFRGKNDMLSIFFLLKSHWPKYSHIAEMARFPCAKAVSQ